MTESIQGKKLADICQAENTKLSLYVASDMQEEKSTSTKLIKLCNIENSWKQKENTASVAVQEKGFHFFHVRQMHRNKYTDTRT